MNSEFLFYLEQQIFFLDASQVWGFLVTEALLCLCRYVVSLFNSGKLKIAC